MHAFNELFHLFLTSNKGLVRGLYENLMPDLQTPNHGLFSALREKFSPDILNVAETFIPQKN